MKNYLAKIDLKRYTGLPSTKDLVFFLTVSSIFSPQTFRKHLEIANWKLLPYPEDIED
jgi:hypothetical protein